MAENDTYLRDVARKALATASGNDIATIDHRQAVLGDCLANATVIRELYALVVGTIEARRKHFWGVLSRFPGSVLSGSVDLLQVLMTRLGELRGFAREHASRFESRGFTSLFAMIEREFGDDYFDEVANHLAELKFRSGVLMSAELGEGNKGRNYVLRLIGDRRPKWLRRLLGDRRPEYTFHLHPRDEAGARALAEMRDRGINLVANATAQSADHIVGFFEMLRAELAFYVGALNLHERLSRRGSPTCFPHAEAIGSRRLRFDGLYDVSLALTMDRRIVGNGVDADRRNLVVITGANQGGKSSFLRSVGLAQWMMQSGLFVGAESFAAEVVTRLFTHYRREEDETMRSGKLDEELSRMSDIADAIDANALVLFNESFTSTNEREGSEIARQIVSALLESGVKVFFVTHLYTFAHGWFEQARDDVLFLRAIRRPDGTRSFTLEAGEPSETSYGKDLYTAVFGAAS
jgi:hypothetical protein